MWFKAATANTIIFATITIVPLTTTTTTTTTSSTTTTTAKGAWPWASLLFTVGP